MATTADTTQAKTDQSETLWQAFVDSPSDETRNALVEHYQPLVREIVRRPQHEHALHGLDAAARVHAGT